MDILNWNRDEYEDLATIGALDEIKDFDNIVIVPSDELHESGYRNMTIVFCRGNTAFAKSFGGSDVIHIDGIGGYGTIYDEIPSMIKPKSWCVDCLPCGYLHMFCRSRKWRGTGISDYEIFAD